MQHLRYRRFQIIGELSLAVRVCFSVGIVLVLGSMGCGGQSVGISQYRLSVSRLTTLNRAVLLYTGDFDDVLPVGGKWMDQLIPYVKDDSLYHSPLIGSRGYGYALNSAIVGDPSTEFASPSTTVTLFDSTDLARNATDSTLTEPSPPRYGNRNTIGFLDGHVQDQVNVTSPPSLYAESVSHLKQVDLGMLIYSNDYDNFAPLPSKWVDGIKPYVKSDSVFRSPAVVLKDENEYGYAFNISVSGESITSFESPSMLLSFFDSTDLLKNATTSTSTLPIPPRYGTKNTLAYVDGHVAPVTKRH